MKKKRALNDLLPAIVRAALLCLILCCSMFISIAQQYTFIQYSLREGLAQSQVRCLFQDSRGFIWAGTLAGASKFDGRNFRNYDRQQGLLNNQVNCIIELKNGTIALGEVGGFSLLNALEIKSYRLPGNMSESTVNSMFQDLTGRLWIGTENGICFFENGNIILPEHSEAPFSSHIKMFTQRPDGSIFITAKEAVYLWSNENNSLFYSPENVEIGLFDLELTSDGAVWLASKGNGLIRIDANGSIKSFGVSEGLWSSTITGILSSENGDLWLSSRFGFFRFDGKTFRSFTEKEGLKTPDIRDIMEDREGNIWLATYGSGMLRFTGEAFVAYTKADGLSSDAVMSITEDEDGAIWFSTFDMGICRMTGDTIERIDLREGSSGNRIWTSLRDKNGTLWFGESDGLFYYTDGKLKPFAASDSLPDRMVLCLYEDSHGRLLIGTSKGLCYIENGIIHSWKNLPGFPETRIRGIREDKAGNIWMATRDGVFRFNGQAFISYTENDGLPDRSTYCVEVDTYNRIWAGTQNGIALLSGTRFVPYVIDDAPGSKTINFIRTAGNHLWVGTLSGLHSLELHSNFRESEIRFRNYRLEDGLRSLETNLNAVFVDSQGMIWIGTPEGVMRADPRVLQKNTQNILPKISFSHIQLNLQDPDWSQYPFPLDTLSGLPVGLEVPYKNNHFTFYFDGISSTYPDDIKYSYMLEGFDDDWQALTPVNFVTYSNLPYSDFTFRVKALSHDGMWSEVISYPFTVHPPIWLSWWFILLEIFAVTGIATAIVMSRRKITLARYEKEQFEMKSRMLTLEQQSLNSSMNRHFIFNALNSIQYYINRQDKISANRYLSDFAKLIRKNLDSSQENLTSLREEIERLELYMKLEHMRFKDKFDYHIHIDPSLDLDAIKVPAMLLQPFLENSIWHGLLPKEAPGKVDVDISKVNEHIEFTIRDNGIGIDNSLKNKTGTDNHISKGMQITTGRIDLIRKMTGSVIELRGPYQLHDENNAPLGTEVKIVLPVNFHELFSN